MTVIVPKLKNRCMLCALQFSYKSIYSLAETKLKGKTKKPLIIAGTYF